jgi:hypothetical protein
MAVLKIEVTGEGAEMLSKLEAFCEKKKKALLLRYVRGFRVNSGRSPLISM